MTKNTLYLMMGYPGAGKTTTAITIKNVSGAVHLWADKIRRERYGRPSYKHSENLALYDHINKLAAELLAAGNSVVFDTNFNFYEDRERLRQIATEHSADTVVIWVQVPQDIAKERATKDAHLQDTRALGDMEPEDFERISNKLEKPRENETVVIIDGTKVTDEYVAAKLGI